MLQKIMRVVSAVASAVLITGAYFAPQVGASGSATVAEIANPVNEVGNTLRSEEVTGQMGWVLMAICALGLIGGVLGGGFVGFFVMFIALGVFFGSQQVAETLGMTALAL